MLRKNHLISAASTLTILALLVFSSSLASAATVHAPNGTSATFERWEAKRGPSARWIADRYIAWDGSNRGLILLLGESAGAIWTAHAGFRDAIDMRSDLTLMQHRADGRVTTFPIVSVREWLDFEQIAYGRPHASSEQTDEKIKSQVHQLALGRLWHLSTNAWPSGRMTAPHGVKTNPYDPDTEAGATGGTWLLEVTASSQRRFRYLLEGTQTMCWTDYDWRWYVVAEK